MQANRVSIIGLIALFMSVALSGCCSSFKGSEFKVPETARIWPSPMAGEANSAYPENSDEKFKSEEENRCKKDNGCAEENGTFGIAFYGGGTRAAPAAVGQIRKLNEYGWFDRASYVSTISGGTWGVAPYIFLPQEYYKFRADKLCRDMWNDKPDKNLSKEGYVADCVDKARNFIADICTKDERQKSTKTSCADRLYLGAYITPEKIGEKGNLGYPESHDPSQVALNYSSANIMADNSYVFIKTMKAYFIKFEGDEAYADVLGNIFLKDIGLYQANQRGNLTINKAFAYDESHISKVLANGNSEVNKKFYFPVKGRPFLIAGTTLMRNGADRQEFYRFEITPLYTGSLGTHIIDQVKVDYGAAVSTCGDDILCYASSKSITETESERKYKVGGYVESYAFDTGKLVVSPSTATINITGVHSAFSLSDMLAASGAAPAQTIRKTGKLLGGNLGFPEFRYGAVIEDDSKHMTIEDWRMDQFGDGGHLENSGIMSLLARKVDRILVFVNSPQPFKVNSKTNHVDIDDNLVSLFGSPEYQHSEIEVESERSKIRNHFSHNSVFKEDELEKLIVEFKKADERHEPLVFCSKYVVQNNEHYNISSYEPTICWVYLQPSKKWHDAINIEECKGNDCQHVSNLKNRIGEFKNFPNYKTFLNDLRDGHPSVIKKSVAQANALSQFTSWSVQQSACEISRKLKLKLPENLTTECEKAEKVAPRSLTPCGE